MRTPREPGRHHHRPVLSGSMASLPRSSVASIPLLPKTPMTSFSMLPKNSVSSLSLAFDSADLLLDEPVVPAYVKSAFLILGAGAFLPWHAVHASADYYNSAFSSVPFESTFTLLHMLPAVVSAVLFVLIPRNRTGYVPDILVGFTFFLAFTLLLAAFAPTFPVEGWASGKLWVLIAITVLSSVASSFVQTALFTTSSLFLHSSCLKQVVSGGGLAAVCMAALHLVSMIYTGSDRFYIEAPGSVEDAAATDAALAAHKATTFIFLAVCTCVFLVSMAELLWISQSGPWNNTFEEAVQFDAYFRPPATLAQNARVMWATISDIGAPFIAIVLGFCVTFAMFPRVFIAMRGREEDFGTDRMTPSWFLVLSMVSFGMGDWIGRAVSVDDFAPSLQTPEAVLNLSLSRLLFAPLALLAGKGVLPLYDFLIIILLAVFGLTNGLVCSTSFLLGVEMVPRSDREKAGKALYMGLMLGLGVGTLLSPLVTSVISLPSKKAAADAVADGTGFLSSIWPGWRRRVEFDPEFPFKVLMEETVGLGLSASGMIAARGEEILNELDFAFCDIMVGATLNFILVYLLSPVAPDPAEDASGSNLWKFLAALPANVFQDGDYSLWQRFLGFVYKGVLFGACAFMGSVVGTILSQALIAIRRRWAEKTGDSTPERQLPNVLVNSLAWASFMFISSNPRYQAVAGIERILFSYTPTAFAKVGSAVLRTSNNVLGGAQWVWWARFLGIQSSE